MRERKEQGGTGGRRVDHGIWKNSRVRNIEKERERERGRKGERENWEKRMGIRE